MKQETTVVEVHEISGRAGGLGMRNNQLHFGVLWMANNSQQCQCL